MFPLFVFPVCDIPLLSFCFALVCLRVYIQSLSMAAARQR